MTHELQTARELAVRAGAIILEHYVRPSVYWKGVGNPVTDADRAASTFLVNELHRLFPADGVLSEEEPDDMDRLGESRVWIVDPLDGTVEFVSHIDEFAVMIGLTVNGEATVGVVYQPTRQKLYYAEHGSGAFIVEDRANRILQVSRESNPAAMTLALSRSHPSRDVDAIQHELGIPKTVSCGSLGLKVGLICEGHAHCYLHTSRHTSQWDTCAPQVILQEAGGRMTDLLNRPLAYNAAERRNIYGVIASNGTIHDRIATTAQSVLGTRIRP